ncbi:hypothetical protein [Desertivirga brevis]|uniref:hypothetical protein n=1 Tax=Desertivirga brevis TaxID=2810310 RepID=UPI001A95EB35|nr:hypothetical protein [Pedobacter sp. SYSU D00873]
MLYIIEIDVVSSIEASRNAHSIVSLYLRQLKKVDTGKYRRININLCEEKIEPRIEFLPIEVATYYSSFDSKHYLTTDEYSKKKLLLNVILEAIIACAVKFNWDKDSFLDAYNRCLELGIVNEWFFKNKLFRSPNRTYYGGIKHIYDFKGFQIYFVLYNAKKEEIGTRLVFKNDFEAFSLEWASWQKSNEVFWFKFKPPKKIFEVIITDVLINSPVRIPHRFSDWFK